MLSIKHNEKTFQVKSSINEFSIGEFEHITSIINDPDRDHLDKWSEIFVYCGLDREVLDDMDTFDFIKLIKEFNIFDVVGGEIIKTLELDGIFYYSYVTDFKISVKEMRMIEDFIKKDGNKYIANVMAVIYKREDTDKNINFDPAHIKHKASLIRTQITADKCVPIINYISQKLVKDFTILNAGN